MAYRIQLILAENAATVRSVPDAVRYLRRLEQRAAKTAPNKQVDLLLKELAAATAAEDNEAFSLRGPASRQPKPAVKIKKLSTAEIEKLAQNWGALSSLESALEEIEAARTSWAIKFRGVQGVSKLMTQLSTTKKELEAKLAKVKAVGSKLAQSSVPASLRAFMPMLVKKLSNEIQWDGEDITFYTVPAKFKLGGKTKTMVSFYAYLTLYDVTTKDDSVYPKYAIVLSYQPTENGYTANLTALREPRLPGKFHPGKPLPVGANMSLDRNALAQVLKRVRTLVEADELFVNSRLAINPGLAFEMPPEVVQTQIDDDMLFVVMKRGTREDQLPTLLSKIKDSIQATMGVTKRKEIVCQKGRLPDNPKQWILRFSIRALAPDQLGYRMTNEKLRDLVDLLGLNQDDVVALRAALR